MNTKLITALRTAANALEQNTFYYKWHDNSSCNCGSLFCALTGRSAVQLERSVPKRIDGSKDNATWTTLIGQHCPITGMPTQKLFKELYSYGLTQRDMIGLEFLNDPAVVSRIKLPPTVIERMWRKPLIIPQKLDYTNRKHVIAYMRAWADLLVERGSLDSPDSEAKARAEVQA